MSNQHTPEPWVFDQQAEIPHVMTPDGYAIVEACPWGSISDQETMSANARRIVACVNACAGIPIGELELSRRGSGLRDVAVVHQSFVYRFEEATTQRDELLAALRRVVADPYFTELDAESQYAAEQSIAKVKQ